ncbi:MAG: hypothetical protein EOP34_01155 [Rickettsiales bacterium]|nr:MAG: hypothetical protein EOP34_01155 [Rickettsiales bacterium]
MYNVMLMSLTSSIKYSNLKDVNAIKIKIKPGVIVQINSTNVPWLTYLLLIPDFEYINLTTMAVNTQPTANNIITK